MLYSILCDKSDAYKAVKGTITVPNTRTVAATNNGNKKYSLKILHHLLIA